MTKSTIARERLQEIAEDGFLKHGESKVLARMALAAMDSEADCKERKLFCSTDTSRMRKVISVSAGTGDAPLYRHAQPAPVVPDEMLCEFYEVDSWPDLVRELVKHVEQLQDSARRNVKPWEDTFPETLLPAYIERVKQADDACRAAMLAAAPQEVPDEK